MSYRYDSATFEASWRQWRMEPKCKTPGCLTSVDKQGICCYDCKLDKNQLYTKSQVLNGFQEDGNGFMISQIDRKTPGKQLRCHHVLRMECATEGECVGYIYRNKKKIWLPEEEFLVPIKTWDEVWDKVCEYFIDRVGKSMNKFKKGKLQKGLMKKWNGNDLQAVVVTEEGIMYLIEVFIS